MAFVLSLGLKPRANSRITGGLAASSSAGFHGNRLNIVAEIPQHLHDDLDDDPTMPCREPGLRNATSRSTPASIRAVPFAGIEFPGPRTLPAHIPLLKHCLLPVERTVIHDESRCPCLPSSLLRISAGAQKLDGAVLRGRERGVIDVQGFVVHTIERP